MALKARLAARTLGPYPAVGTTPKNWTKWEEGVECFEPCDSALSTAKLVGQTPNLCMDAGDFAKLYKECIDCLGLGPLPSSLTISQKNTIKLLLPYLDRCLEGIDSPASQKMEELANLPRPSFSIDHIPEAGTQVDMFAQSSSASPTPTLWSALTESAAASPATSSATPHRNDEAPSWMPVLMFPVYAGFTLIVVFAMVEKYKKRKTRQDVEAGEIGIYGKSELASDGVLQVEPQEMSADPPKPRELEAYERPVELDCEVIQKPPATICAQKRETDVGGHSDTIRWYNT